MSDTDDLLRDSDRWKRSYDRDETNYATMLTARGVIGSFDSALRDALATVEQMRRERDDAYNVIRRLTDGWIYDEPDLTPDDGGPGWYRGVLPHSYEYDEEDVMSPGEVDAIRRARASQPVTDSRGEGTG